MNNYNATIVSHPPKHLIGMKVLTSMQKASVDCPALWQAFDSRIRSVLPAGCACKGSYGLSVMLNAEEFYYWAAVEADLLRELPPDMEYIDILAGQYVRCPVPNLENLAGAYMFLYGTWLNDQSEYTLNEHAPCFEQYPPNWRLSDSFEIFMPIEKR